MLESIRKPELGRSAVLQSSCENGRRVSSALVVQAHEAYTARQAARRLEMFLRDGRQSLTSVFVKESLHVVEDGSKVSSIRVVSDSDVNSTANKAFGLARSRFAVAQLFPSLDLDCKATYRPQLSVADSLATVRLSRLRPGVDGLFPKVPAGVAVALLNIDGVRVHAAGKDLTLRWKSLDAPAESQGKAAFTALVRKLDLRVKPVSVMWSHMDGGAYEARLYALKDGMLYVSFSADENKPSQLDVYWTAGRAP